MEENLDIFGRGAGKHRHLLGNEYLHNFLSVLINLSDYFAKIPNRQSQ